MGSVTKYFLIGLIAIHTIQQSIGKPAASPPDCTNLKDGEKIPGKNKSSFFFCHKGKAFQAHCPSGHDFCYTGQFGICSKWCMNMEDTDLEEQGETENTQSPVDGDGDENASGGSGEDSGDKSGEDSDDKSGEKCGEKSSEESCENGGENEGETGGEETGGEETGEETKKPETEQTTSAPTTSAPTTSAPTTSAPTTAEPTTTQSTAPTTTPEPPNPESACDKKPFGSIFAIKNDCSAFGICMFGKTVISKCLGNRRFDPKLGVCTGIKCK